MAQTLVQITTTEGLEDRLSEPTEQAIDVFRQLDGDLLMLGVGGKMGRSLARMARRASEAAGTSRRIIAASRFTNAAARESLERDGIDTVVCDLTSIDDVQKLPNAPNVLYMAGMKFGTSNRPGATWATNCLAPALICETFRDSRVVAFSTGNVYSLVPVDSGGSKETDPPGPVGEYAMTALGRERIFDYFSERNGTRIALLRLNYACDLRYGVLVDLAEKVLFGNEIDLAIGYINTIWQGDANAMALCAFGYVASPPFVVNITGAERISVREAAQQFGRLLGKEPRFINTEMPNALLSNSERGRRLLGEPRYSADELLHGVAAWIQRGGKRLGKPTHYEVADGKF